MDGSAGRPVVIEAEPLHPDARAWLAERCEVVSVPRGETLTLHAALAGADGLVIRTATRVDAALLDSAPKLRVIGRAGVGVDHIDLAECAARGVRVVNTPDANTQAVVEFVFASLFDALRPRVYLDRAIDAHAWESARADLVARRELGSMRLGIYGMGRIGSRIARAARGLGIDAIYHDLIEVPADRRFGAEPVSRDRLLAEADIISVHVDGRPANRGLVGTDAFGRMKSDVVFVNTSRGLVVDPVATAEFMIAHPGACAVLDVHDPEPIEPTSPLWEIQNVHLSPHIASATAGAKAAMSWVVRDVWRVLSGEEPESPVASLAQ